jgi:sterol desaturase/sphingolipid hydroxylase (fatty acid hydroxylase superfamily)
MVTLALVLLVAFGCIVVERLWPANELPRVRAWYARVALVNMIQLGLVVLAGLSWDRWLSAASLFHLADHMSTFAQSLVAYVVSTLVYYGWHRLRHESMWFWNVCHQLHHSPRRIEILTAFYKHPVEIFFNSVLSAAIVYTLLGCSVSAGAWYTVWTALAEFFYHWNIRTPRWLGYLVQRPESHRIHHRYRHHTQNFADLPVWDMIFGTFANAIGSPARCGFDSWREDRFEDMLVFRNVNGRAADARRPLHLLPTCIGCSKRWACHEAQERSRPDSTP